MESSKERDQKLAAARKKLKKFKSQKGNRTGGEHETVQQNVTDSSVSDSSAVESLMQLSSQLNGLLDDSANAERSITNGSATNHSYNGRRSPIGGSNNMTSEEAVMERNRELAGKVRELQQKNTQLTRQMQIQTEHLNDLQNQLSTSESETSEKIKHELQQTREQLQVHIQTIGILVEEKQTLQKQLSTVQKQNQQKSDELEDFTSRLKASRLRVVDLEKQLALSNTQKARAESAHGDNSKQVEKLKTDLYTKSRDLDEVLEQRNQLEKQLQARLAQNAELEASLTDLNGKLELSQAYILQISNGSDNSAHPNLYSEQIEELKAQNATLHESIAQLEESLQRVMTERMQTIEQYNQVISSLQNEQQQLHSQYESSQNANNSLELELQELKASNSQLHYQIEHLQSEKDSEQQTSTDDSNTTEKPVVYTVEQVQELLRQYESLRLNLEAITKNNEAIMSDNQQLSRLLEEKEERVSELELTLERIQDEKDNSKKLLESVEGDKSALSRALTQNKQLKIQLEELESRFIKITEDQMETLTALQREQHVNSELSNKLGNLEDQYKLVSDNLKEKESYLTEHQDRVDQVSKMSHQQEQLADRIRHYEAKVQVTDALQRELHSSQETVRALTAQNSQLRQMIVEQGMSQQSSADTDDVIHNSSEATSSNSEPVSDQQSNLIQQLSTAIQQLEAEKTDLQNRLEDSILERNKLSNQLLAQREPQSDPHDTSPEQYDALQHAMSSLQDKYTVMMRSRAELTDRCELLEYENLQLQAESETINEYIQLYHHQRSLLKQRAEDKDRVIQRLSEEKEKTTAKMSELQGLVVKLLHERQLIQSYKQEVEERNGWPGNDDTELTQNGDVIHPSDDITQPIVDDVTMESGIVAHNNGSSTPVADLTQDFVDGNEQVPGVTAQRIMTLLSEIGHNNKIERNVHIPHILHCSHCSGPVVSM